MIYAQILDLINQNIKQNGKEEITGNILNSVLRSLLDFINSQNQSFNGILTTQTKPNNITKGFWFATEGVYSKFGVSVPENNLGVVYWDNGYKVDLIDLVNEQAIKYYINQQLVNVNLGFGGEITSLNQSPTIDGMYLPKIIGVYPNFGNLEYLESDGFVVFLYKDDVFSKIVIPLNGVEEEVNYNNNTLGVSGSAVEKYSVKKINTIADLRNTQGEYNGQIISLLGYYEAGDKESLNYKFKITQGVDDGGSVINAGSGSWLAVFDNVVDVRHFGVKSDGITDDSVSFQKLIDRLSDLGGGDIILPSGVTVCNITIPSKVNIVGQGSNVSILKSANGSNKDVIKGKDFDVLTGTPKETPETRGVRNITFRGFSVDGNKQKNSNGYGIRIWGCSWKWEDVIVANCKSGGIWTEFTTHEYPNDDFSAVLEALESNFTRIKTIANDGNGWDWHGVHDSEINDYVTFRNKGWGFNQVKGSVNGYHWNSWLNYHSFNFETNVTLDNIIASGEEGIGISMPKDTSSCKITNVIIAGHETGLIMRGSLHYIQGYIQNITDTAIVNDNMSFCNIDLIIYNVKYLYKQINNGLYNRYNIIGQQLEGQSILEAGNDWIPNVLESCYLAVKQPSDVIYVNRVVGDKLWINGWKPTIPGSNGVMLTNSLMPSDSTATDVSSLVNDFNILLQRLREGN